MKYRICERHDGRYEVQKKYGYFAAWNYRDVFFTYKEAKEYIESEFKIKKRIDLQKKGRKIKKVIEVIDE